MEPGTKLGHYEISTLLGKGGMGEVWRARDTKLGREVAIKTLPTEFAKDADRLARFEREAKLLASLNHPNIAAIHGFEEDSGTHFLVLELVEGDTLADRLNRGPIPVEDSLKFALQIADALKAAHDKGVIHRDLKPLNIKLTDDDTVKVLDFGLAKAFAGDETEASVSNSPTLSMAATQQGVILGTAAYMSPKQAKGRAVDKRTDIFAFGCVLYEMLSGHQSFGKSDVAESLSAVISLQPEWTTLPANLHPRLREAVERCLEKPVTNRFQDIGDVRVDIEKVLADPSGVILQRNTDAVRAASKSKVPWVVAVCMTVLVAAGVWFLKPEPAGLVTRFQIPLRNAVPGSNVAWSPDGRVLVFAMDGQLYQRRMDQVDAVRIPGTEGGKNPFFAPNGESIAFFTAGELKRSSLSGLAPQVLLDLPGGWAGTWARDGYIYFGAISGESLWRIPDRGGPREEVAVALGFDEYVDLAYPEILPGRDWMLFNAESVSDRRFDVLARSLVSDDRKVVLENAVRPRYTSTGHLVFGREGRLFAVGFDPEQVETVGEPIPVLDRVFMAGGFRADFAVSPNGALAYKPGTGFEDNVIAIVDTNGAMEQTGLLLPGTSSTLRISADGTRVAYTNRVNEGFDIHVYSISGGTQPRRLTFGGGNRFPIWSADGEWVAFQTPDMGIARQRADGSGALDILVPPDDGFVYIPDSFSPVDEFLSFTAIGNGASSVQMLDLDDRNVTTFAEVPGRLLRQSVFSPNGQWVAYQSNQTLGNEIWVAAFPEGDRAMLPPTLDNHHPTWSVDGSTLFYIPGPFRFESVGFTTDAGIVFGNPAALPVNTLGSAEGGPDAIRNFDVMPDGRFIGVFSNPRENAVVNDAQQIEVVLNWIEELKERVPVPWNAGINR